MKKFLIYTTAAGLLLIARAATAGAEKDTDHFWLDGGNSLQGSWQVETTVRLPADDCTTAPLVPPSGPNPFPTFSSFHFGGTMTEQGSRSSPAFRSPGFGVWERTGRREYAYHLMFHSFGENRLLSAIMDIRTTVSLAKSGDTFDGVSRFVRTDTGGNVLHFCATMTGERITL